MAGRSGENGASGSLSWGLFLKTSSAPNQSCGKTRIHKRGWRCDQLRLQIDFTSNFSSGQCSFRGVKRQMKSLKDTGMCLTKGASSQEVVSQLFLLYSEAFLASAKDMLGLWFRKKQRWCHWPGTLLTSISTPSGSPWALVFNSPTGVSTQHQRQNMTQLSFHT